MPVTHDDLQQPKGRLELEYFPDDDATTFNARLDAYLADGADEASARGATDPDRATKAWAYYRAYSAIVERLANAPATSTVDGEFNATFSSDQRKVFVDAAAHYLGAFEALCASVDPLETQDDTTRGSSMSAGVRFRF